MKSIRNTFLVLATATHANACSTNVPIGVGPQAAAEYYRTGKKSWERPTESKTSTSTMKAEKTNAQPTQYSQLILGPDDSFVDPRVIAARKELLAGYGRSKQLTFSRAVNYTGQNSKLIENEARDFVALLGGTSVPGRRGNFYINIVSTAKHGSPALFYETITVEIGNQTGAMASYTAELKCGPNDQWRYRDKSPRGCRIDKSTIREIFYRLAKKITG